MAGTTAQSFWPLVARQHGVISHGQLLALGFTLRAIEHRIEKGRLRRLFRSVYAVGRPEVAREARWMAAVLACGEGAALSHFSAAVLWGVHHAWRRDIDVSVPAGRHPRQEGIRVHRRRTFETTKHSGIPVTTPICTLVDIAPGLGRDQRERAVNEADKLGLVDPVTLRQALDDMPRRPGLRLLKDTLDRHTFTITDSELERLFIPIALRAGLPMPLTQQWVNGFRVDFYWPDLRLVVETDGLTYHRTPAEQAEDRLRDQVHSAAGLTPLRFTRAQVRFEPAHVESVLAAVRTRLVT